MDIPDRARLRFSGQGPPGHTVGRLERAPGSDISIKRAFCDNEEGWLKPGFGAKSDIGPELGFGWVVGDAIDEPVLCS
jgi:hypothetical protein